MPRDAQQLVGARIRAARGRRSQDWLATQLGVHQTTVSKWEKGTATPGVNMLPRIERTLGMDAAELSRIVYGAQPPADPPSYEHLGEALREVEVIREALDRLEGNLRQAMP